MDEKQGWRERRIIWKKEREMAERQTVRQRVGRVIETSQRERERENGRRD